MIKIGDKVRHTSPSIKGFGEVIEVDLKENLVVVLFAKDKKFTFGLDETSDFVTPANDEFKALKGRADMIAECRNELRSLTNDGVTFSKLDSYFINERGLNPDEYKKIKDDYLKEYFKNKINLPLNAEQIDAIEEINNHVLLKARAGSGKTRVITAKAFFLMDHEKCNPKEVMLLAFNKVAAKEMTNRINKEYKLGNYKNARTFHSLAYKLGYKENATLLFDENNFSISTQKQSAFVQDLIKEAANPAFKKKLYKLFRQEAEELENLGELLKDKDYLTYRRDLDDITLNGDQVKSLGEKWIGDFLFEHDLTHYYEQNWPVKDGGWDFKLYKGGYKPDFSLLIAGKKSDVVIEHWGIDENNERRKTPDHWGITWDEYRETMNRKRQYWETYNSNKPLEPVAFIETSIVDMTDESGSYNRNHFENILKAKLTHLGIKVNKLSEEELFSKLEKIQVARITQLFMSFIGKTTKRRWTPDDLENKISKVDSNNLQLNGFYELGANIYRRYVEKLERENILDFDGLIESAIKTINDTKGDCQLNIDENNSIAINELKYLMVDEYQDFSPLFYEMIKTIMNYNQDIKVFCVGDDWQAINSFAGSDLYFFNEFKSCFNSSFEMSLLTNYRSTRNIVQLSNNFMNGLGDQSKAYYDEKGFIGQCLTNNMYIDPDMDLGFIPESKNNFVDYEIAKLLKFCYSILTRTNNPGRTALIINRTNDIGGWHSKEKFKKNLLEICSDKIQKDDFKKNIKVVTAHGSKGDEADIVILLNANNKKYPLVHPDNAFNLIFDKNCIENSLKEERRLFYVAMTRSKEQLYFVSAEDKESDFVKEIKEDWTYVKENDLFINYVPNEFLKS